MKDYKPLPSCLTIQNSSINGLGLFATTDIPKGKYLGTTHYITDKSSVLRTPLGGFYNHSDTPNTVANLAPECYKKNGMRYIEMTTTKNISPGEEITSDYFKTLKQLKEIMDEKSIIKSRILNAIEVKASGKE